MKPQTKDTGKVKKLTKQQLKDFDSALKKLTSDAEEKGYQNLCVMDGETSCTICYEAGGDDPDVLTNRWDGCVMGLRVMLATGKKKATVKGGGLVMYYYFNR